MVKVGKTRSAGRPERSRTGIDLMDIIWDLGESPWSGPHAAPARLSTFAVAGVLVLSVVTLSIGGTLRIGRKSAPKRRVRRMIRAPMRRFPSIAP